LTEAEFWDNIKGLQPQIYFLGISYQQVCDINRKYLSLVLLYQQVYYFRLVMWLIYLLYSLELCLLLIRCFLSIGFKYCTLVFFKEKQSGAFARNENQEFHGVTMSHCHELD
jgi:hypothetical protein